MIDSEEIKSEYQVKLVGVLIDNKLSYDEYISACLKNASTKLNSINDSAILYQNIKRKY